MAGSIYGNQFCVTTWGESHGRALGVVVDGCPEGIRLSEEDIQKFLSRRRPGHTKYASGRDEEDKPEILSGIFEGKTTGTPISIVIWNTNQNPKDYSNIAHAFRPGHADYTFFEKYGFRDYRGGGRSSGRETVGRVAAGAIASLILKQLGITLTSYVRSIGPVEIESYNEEEISQNVFCMPDKEAAAKAEAYVQKCLANHDSAGGIVECRIKGVPAGIGETVFDKLDASLAKAIMSIGAVKGFEIGDGFAASRSNASQNNDQFEMNDRHVEKLSNHAGGILGGMSDGSEIVLRAAFKPTPSISQPQKTVMEDGTETMIEIHGRHDPVIVPRAAVVVESMAAITLVDLLFANMTAQMDHIRDFYSERD